MDDKFKKCAICGSRIRDTGHDICANCMTDYYISSENEDRKNARREKIKNNKNRRKNNDY